MKGKKWLLLKERKVFRKERERKGKREKEKIEIRHETKNGRNKERKK